jgi:hypothetical protein
MKPFDAEACEADVRKVFANIPYYSWDDGRVARFVLAFKAYNEGEINIHELQHEVGEKRSFLQAHFGKYLNRELAWNITVVEVTPRTDFKEPNYG